MTRLLAIVVVFVMAGISSAQNVRLHAESLRTRERLDEGAELERGQRDTEALEHYLKLIADVPDEWVPVLEGRVLRPCRQVVLSRIGVNPRMREAYRARFEQMTDVTVRRAIERKDSRELNRLAAEHWPTLAAGKALDARGDLAWEHGDMAHAIHCWRLLAGPPRDGETMFPDWPAVASVRAKSILAARMQGNNVDADVEVFRRDFPDVSGRLAGREGRLAELLTSNTEDLVATIPRVEPTTARTFGANENRIGAISKRLPQLAPRRIELAIAWPSCEVQSDVRLPERNPIASPRQLTTHPQMWSGKLVVADGERIVALDPDTGLIADVFAISGRPEQPIAENRTLTTDGSRVYARINKSTLVCLAVDTAAASWKWRKVWELKASTLGDNVEFEGCPIVSDGRLYVSWLSSAVNRANLTLACFAADRSSQGPLWTNIVAEIQLEAGRHRLPLLTLAGPNIVYGTDAGTVIALDARNGKPVWAANYSSRGPRGLPANLLPVPRDLCPPVAVDGRVFVAPADSDAVLAFDTYTGVPLWNRPPMLEVVHMLGIIGGKLIVTASGIYHGIGAIDVRSGTIDTQWGKLDAAAPFGRGLILGDCVLFPTRLNGLLVLDRAGQPVYQPTLFHNLPGGNLAYDDGTLVIATADHLIRLSYAATAARRPSAP